MNAADIPTAVLDFLATPDDRDPNGNFTQQSLMRLTAEAQRTFSDDDARVIIDFNDRFMAAVRSLTTASDCDARGNLTRAAIDRVRDEAWMKAQPDDYVDLMKKREATRIFDEAIADGVIEYADEEHLTFREGLNWDSWAAHE